MIARNDAIHIQPRDVELMRDLCDSRVMLLSHAAKLHFDGKAEAAKKRIQRLKSVGLIGERPRQPSERSALFLTMKGFELLSKEGHLAGAIQLSPARMKSRLQVSALSLKHELAVIDAKAALSVAVAKSERFQIAEFTTWPLLYQFFASPEPGQPDELVKPDGFLRIHEQDESGNRFEHVFFIEIDRGTHSQNVLARCAACYVDYYRRGGLAIRNGATAADFKDHPFRTLMIFQTAERRNNTAERLLLQHPPILTQVWLTTMKELLTEPLDAIWVRPLDYRQVTASTIDASFPPRSSPTYRRHAQREEVIEKTVTKRSLLAEL